MALTHSPVGPSGYLVRSVLQKEIKTASHLGAGKRLEVEGLDGRSVGREATGAKMGRFNTVLERWLCNRPYDREMRVVNFDKKKKKLTITDDNDIISSW